MRGFESAKRLRRVRAVALAFAAALASVPFAGSALVVSQPLTDPDAIVSLASHEWERLPVAADLAQAFPGALVLLTVPEEVTPHNCHDCAHRVDRLGELGVDPGRIRLVDLRGPGTHGEARALLAFAREAGLHRLVVVTSPYHTRRAFETFREVFQETGAQIGVVPAERTSPARPDRWFLAPYDRAYVAYEWSAIAYYVMRYGIVPV